MTALAFTVPGRPVTWKRTNRVNGRSITPRGQREYQAHVAFCGQVARGSSWDATKRYRLSLVVYAATKGRSDLDNHVKNFGDALNGVLWDDDSQIDAIDVERRHDPKTPRVEVRVQVMA